MSLVLSNASILRNKSSCEQVSAPPPRLSFSLIALGLYFIICFSSTFTLWKQVLAVEVFCLWPSSCWFALLVGYQPRKNNPDFLMISCTCICFADTWAMTVMCGPCMSSLFLISQPSSTQNLWRSSTPQCVVVILPALKAYVFFFSQMRLRSDVEESLIPIFYHVLLSVLPPLYLASLSSALLLWPVQIEPAPVRKEFKALLIFSCLAFNFLFRNK